MSKRKAASKSSSTEIELKPYTRPVSSLFGPTQPVTCSTKDTSAAAASQADPEIATQEAKFDLSPSSDCDHTASSPPAEQDPSPDPDDETVNECLSGIEDVSADIEELLDSIASDEDMDLVAAASRLGAAASRLVAACDAFARLVGGSAAAARASQSSQTASDVQSLSKGLANSTVSTQKQAPGGVQLVTDASALASASRGHCPSATRSLSSLSSALPSRTTTSQN